jgi:hypothetical protein
LAEEAEEAEQLPRAPLSRCGAAKSPPQPAAARREEADQHLETLFALPVGRRGWLGGRLLLASGAVAVVSVTAGLFTWAGAASAGEARREQAMCEIVAHGRRRSADHDRPRR